MARRERQQSGERSFEEITAQDLARLADLAAADLDGLFRRRPGLAERYRDRVICAALCQGAALHYVDGRNGVKDFDVWTFLAEHPDAAFPHRRRKEVDFGASKFGRTRTAPARFEGRRVDMLGRSLPEPPGADPVAALRRYLEEKRTASAQALARKAVVLLTPERLRGTVVWPAGR
jgi:hypothetical protein